MQELNIVKLDEFYKGKKVTFRYESDYYYDIEYKEIEEGFQYRLI